ncbi:S-methyl-5-thioribose-1-phosphate isomerase [Bacteriovorax sp. BSW11_IV]|uniref:S-methyl-5-thioribose-1-phosphate isomerase n=1 Tax=Bacteriovorax sp. BSW11_IV TaxID=1353529 RepID=UPI000389E073|nr:S-methyl-5-thioribose-1-phosphate isomerase [Bacteriovorax sp. BSW11_IV]EQC47063.1 S-methyl-5-thioribose-1-phosphate isomerase [Bacteriovorax sp. BSW11_IV]
MTEILKPLVWKNEKLYLLDQRKLPLEEIVIEVDSVQGVFDAIKDMVVRGAPLIGFTGIWGQVIALQNDINLEKFIEVSNYINSSRPTAVNLEFELNVCVDKAKKYFNEHGSLKGLKEILEKHAHLQMEELHNKNYKMAQLAEEELKRSTGHEGPYTLMTICNTGYLACGPMGTALGVISYLHKKGKIKHVFASETRPYMQGIRLTAYELSKEGIPHQVTVEGASSYLLKEKGVDAIFAGADRIVANGDTANKVGTSTLSIVANHYNVPFYIVAPITSFDLNMKTGNEIPIEMRDELEILEFRGIRVAPEKSRALNPSFDVTDHKTITGIFCENGLIKPVLPENVSKVVGK